MRIGERPVPLTPEGAYRYADLVVDREHDRLICVREDHTADGEPKNTLVAVRLTAASNFWRKAAIFMQRREYPASGHTLPDTMAASEHAVGRDGTRYR